MSGRAATTLDRQLRERWSDPDVGAAAIRDARSELRQRLEHDDGSALASSHIGRAEQRLSEALRLGGELVEALDRKDAVIERWVALDKRRAAFLVGLQRAVVLAELGRHEAAKLAQQSSWSLMDGNDDLQPYYADVWYEYEGRRLALRGDREGAAEALTQALQIRRADRADWIADLTQTMLGYVS